MGGRFYASGKMFLVPDREGLILAVPGSNYSHPLPVALTAGPYGRLGIVLQQIPVPRLRGHYGSRPEWTVGRRMVPRRGGAPSSQRGTTMQTYDNRPITLDPGLTALALRGLHERDGHYPFLDRFVRRGSRAALAGFAIEKAHNSCC